MFNTTGDSGRYDPRRGSAAERDNVAEENTKEAVGTEPTAKPKRSLPALVLVAVGAVAGGAVVVFAVPPKTVEVPVEKPVLQMLDVTHPDPMKHQFNPRTKAGKGVAVIELQFVYRVREDLEHEAFEQIRQNWLFANSNVLVMLKGLSWEELTSESGGKLLEKQVLDELDRTLFPATDGHKAAKVTRVVWTKWLMQ
jgi:hypothetical protein